MRTKTFMPAAKRNRQEKTKRRTTMRRRSTEERAEVSRKGLKKDVRGAGQKKTGVGEQRSRIQFGAGSACG